MVGAPNGTAPDASATGANSSNCPIPERYRRGPVYNVYNQRIDGERSVAAPCDTLPLDCWFLALCS